MSQDNIFEFIQVFDNEELSIQINKDIISFTKKNNITYCVKLKRSENNLKFTSADDDLKNIHFSETLNKSKLNAVDQLPELIEFITNLDLNNYCVVCQNKLDFQSDTFVACGKDECLYKYEELIVGNPIMEKITKDDEICQFLLESAIDAIKCERKYDIFEPFPTHFLKHATMGLKRGTVSKLDGKNYDQEKDFTKIDSLLGSFDIEKFMKLIENCKTDKELAQSLGNDLYILIRFILMSCKVDILKNDDILGISSKHFKIYKINHQPDKDNEFKELSKNGQNSFLFHGSRWCNWYSILRNGLKNCSGSKLMTTGAAYGNGIYLSEDVTLSFGYGQSGNKSIVGVFEVINKEKYLKGAPVYVVDDEKVLIQRYLLIIPNNYKMDFFREINNLFNKKIYEDKLNATIKYNKKSIAKILREYQQLMKIQPDKSSFRMDVNPDYPFLLKIFVSKFDDKYPIAQDMKKFNVKEIELEIRFPEDYPFSPPFIRVVSPRFAHLTGHVVYGSGAFCNELLTPKNWMPTFTVESLVTLLISEIIEGNGRLDPKMYNIPYSYEEAKEGFNRVAKSHGWM